MPTGIASGSPTIGGVMAFAEHLRVSAIGDIGDDPVAEQFSYGFCMANMGGGIPVFVNPGPNDASYQDIADSVKDFHGRAASKISSQAVLRAVKIAAIGTDGKYTDDPRIFPYTQAGGNPHNQQCLPQAALVVSLRTNLRSASGKGRFYIPMPMVNVIAGNGFLINTDVAEGIRDSAATMLNDVNNAAGFDGSDDPQVVIASTTGINTRVTGVRVGRVVDTMRSRRNKLLESYTSVAAVS